MQVKKSELNVSHAGDSSQSVERVQLNSLFPSSNRRDNDLRNIFTPMFYLNATPPKLIGTQVATANDG